MVVEVFNQAIVAVGKSVVGDRKYYRGNLPPLDYFEDTDRLPPGLFLKPEPETQSCLQVPVKPRWNESDTDRRCCLEKNLKVLVL